MAFRPLVPTPRHLPVTVTTGNRRGFTLIEAALATIIVGVGVVSMMQLLAACTYQNRAASQSTVAMYLAQCVQEMTNDMPFVDPNGGPAVPTPPGGLLLYNNLDNFNGWNTTATVPVDSTRQALPQLANYAQRVTVTSVNPNNFSLPGTDCKVVRVDILYRSRPTDSWSVVYTTSWVRTR